jgi:phosphotransferase system HPr (HPr) family protein
MISKSVTLSSNDFFHARPAAKIADAAKSYESVIMVMLGTEIADAKNAFSLMRLSHPKGSSVDILADTTAITGVIQAIQEEFTPH